MVVGCGEVTRWTMVDGDGEGDGEEEVKVVVRFWEGMTKGDGGWEWRCWWV